MILLNRVILAVGATDLRKGFEGLFGLVKDRLGLEACRSSGEWRYAFFFTSSILSHGTRGQQRTTCRYGGRGIPIVSLRRMSRPIATLRPATPADIGAIDLPIT
jgi:hypothetical protein